MTLDSQLLALLVDPDDHEPLTYVEPEQLLYNPRTRRKYAIDNDIPVLLVDEAQVASDDEHARFTDAEGSK
jgi:uncharacterized protein